MNVSPTLLARASALCLLASFATAQSEDEAPAVERWLAVTGGDVHLGTGQVMRRATVLVGDAKIESVGHDLDIPEGATVIDASGHVVAPGFVSPLGSGMGTPFSLSEGDLIDSLNPYEPSIKMGLAAGITSFVAAYDLGSTKPGGRTAVVKLAYGDLPNMIVESDTVTGMKVPLTPSQWRSLRESVEKAREKLTEYEEAEEGKAKEPDDNTKRLWRLMKGETRLWVACDRSFDTPAIRQALELAELFGHGVVLNDPVTAWTIPDEIAATGSMAIINPRRRDRPDPTRENTGTNIAACALLHAAGVPVAVRPPGGFGGSPSLGTGGILGQDLHTLHLDAAFAVRGGLDDAKALRTITLDAAKIAGVDHRVGSIEAGKDADLLILDGDPLHYRTFVTTAIVNGKVVYQKDKEPFYSHIRRQ